MFRRTLTLRRTTQQIHNSINRSCHAVKAATTWTATASGISRYQRKVDNTVYRARSALVLAPSNSSDNARKKTPSVYACGKHAERVAATRRRGGGTLDWAPYLSAIATSALQAPATAEPARSQRLAPYNTIPHRRRRYPIMTEISSRTRVGRNKREW